jgi:hypothetical protein
VIHNLVVEVTRSTLEVKSLKMRLESMASRLDFDERRARALEGVVQYRPGVAAPLQPPTGQPDRGRQDQRHDQRHDQRRDQGPRPPQGPPGPGPGSRVPGQSGPEPSAPGQNALDNEGNERRARRRRRRGRRRGGEPGRIDPNSPVGPTFPPSHGFGGPAVASAEAGRSGVSGEATSSEGMVATPADQGSTDTGSSITPDLKVGPTGEPESHDHRTSDVGPRTSADRPDSSQPPETRQPSGSKPPSE